MGQIGQKRHTRAMQQKLKTLSLSVLRLLLLFNQNPHRADTIKSPTKIHRAILQNSETWIFPFFFGFL